MRLKNSVLKEGGNKLLRTPPPIFDELMKAKCRNEIFLCDWCDRLDATLVHQADALRTLISYKKETKTIFHKN